MEQAGHNDFLSLLCGDIHAGFMTLWAKFPDDQKKTLWYDLAQQNALSDMSIEGERLVEQGADVYFSTCPATSKPARNAHRVRIRQKDVCSIPAFFMDVDTKQDASKDKKAVPDTVEAAVVALNSLSCPPSALVCSGHGVHAYWKLDTPASPQAAGQLKSFAQAVAAATGYTDLDTHASEPARVLRLPGTLNCKGGGFVPVKVLESSGQVYTLEQLEAFIKEHEKKASTKGSTSKHIADIFDDSSQILTDSQLIQKACRAKNGTKFSALYQGLWEGYYTSQSEADQAFCDSLAFWACKDQERMDAIYRKSGLMRDKWDRPQSGSTYGRLTLDKAIGDCHTVYTPQAHTGHALSFEDKPGACTSIKVDAFDKYERAYELISGYCAKHGITYAETIKGDEVQLVPLATFAALITKQIIRDNGQEQKKEFGIEGITSQGKLLPPCIVPAREYESMGWVLNNWCLAANIFPGSTIKGKLKFAIQQASMPHAKEQTIYAHSGWRKLQDGRMAFLYHGGARRCLR